jgi:prepilin-type N-terminal cleavage/methylation domain-containing protein
MKRHQLGFTLFEIVITLAVMAILAAIAIPSFSGMIARTHARDSAQSISTGLDWAKSFAISSSRVVSYTAKSDCSWTASAGNSVRSGTASMPHGVVCQAFNVGSIYFLPDGSVTQATTNQPSLTKTLLFTVTGGGNTWNVTLDPTGISEEVMTW